jgi:hypothetical protein
MGSISGSFGYTIVSEDISKTLQKALLALLAAHNGQLLQGRALASHALQSVHTTVQLGASLTAVDSRLASSLPLPGLGHSLASTATV